MTQANAPQNLKSFVARIRAEGLFRRIVQEIHEPAVIGLPEIVKRTAQQKMKVEFAAQSPQFTTDAPVQNGLRHTERAAKSGDDASDRRDFHLPCRISNQIHRALADLAAAPGPNPYTQDSGPLEFDRVELSFLDKLFEFSPCVRSLIRQSHRERLAWAIRE